jgi:23S rRNA pseudouridine1911/1915/1917 synthase
MALEILHEDAALIVIDKPPASWSIPAAANWEGTLLNALLAHVPALAEIPRAGIVHRLDKDTSGLLVVAKTLVAQTDLVRQLQAARVTRVYAAVVHAGHRTRRQSRGADRPPSGKSHAHGRQRAGKPAVTHYQVMQRFAAATLLECRLETGRTHQIRVHLASLGHPLIGDPVYGRRHAAESIPDFHRQALHARKLGLVHPVSGRTMSWEAPLPDDMRELLANLEKTPSHA